MVSVNKQWSRVQPTRQASFHARWRTSNKWNLCCFPQIRKMSFHGILYFNIKIVVAPLALRLAIDNTYIHTYYSKHIIL